MESWQLQCLEPGKFITGGNSIFEFWRKIRNSNVYSILLGAHLGGGGREGARESAVREGEADVVVRAGWLGVTVN